MTVVSMLTAVAMTVVSMVTVSMVTVVTWLQAILMSMSLQGMVDELIQKKNGDRMKQVSVAFWVGHGFRIENDVFFK